MDVYIAVGIITFMILFDQITKIIAQKTLRNKSDINLLKNHLSFTYLENSGMAMGRLNGKYIFFYIMTILALFAFTYFSIYINFKTRIGYSIGLSILIAGTVGNLLDRVLRGYVIDFITGKIFKKQLPVFNIADFSIMIGSLMTLIFGLIEV